MTQTSNNQPGMLSARIIKALCKVLDQNPAWRDSGLILFDAFDYVDLGAIHVASALDAATRKVGRDVAIADRVCAEPDGYFRAQLTVVPRVAAE